jgi:hypothetical protein
MRKSKKNLEFYQQLTAKPKKSEKIKTNFFSKRKAQSLYGKTPNFLRVGCPTECLIHIPHHIAVLNKKSSINLATSSLSIKDMINLDATKRFQENSRSVKQVWNFFDSVKIPISSFSQIKVPDRGFTLDSVDYTSVEPEKKRILEKVSSEKYLKPLSSAVKSIKDSLIIDSNTENLFFKSPYLKKPNKYKQL